MKTKMMMVVALVGLVSTAAWAEDSVQIKSTRSGKTVTISGQSNGVAAEAFSVMDKAGFQSQQLPGRKEITGRRLLAKARYMNGVSYELVLKAENGSATVSKEVTEDNKVVLSISGDVAAELYDAMGKAGVPFSQGREGRTYKGKLLSCSSMAMHHVGARCELTLQSAQ